MEIMEIFLVNIGIFGLVCLFGIIVFFFPFISTYLIAIAYLATFGMANYYTAFIPPNSVPDFLVLVFVVCFGFVLFRIDLAMILERYEFLRKY